MYEVISGLRFLHEEKRKVHRDSKYSFHRFILAQTHHIHSQNRQHFHDQVWNVQTR